MSEKFKDQKIIGYALLIAGLCIMGYSIASVINVFNGGEVPIEILHAEETTDTSQENIGNETMPNIDMSQLITPMFPLFNLMAWLAIAFFLVAAGGRVARLGIKMMKASLPDVKVIKSERTEKKERNMKMKESKEEDKNKSIDKNQ